MAPFSPVGSDDKSEACPLISASCRSAIFPIKVATCPAKNALPDVPMLPGSAYPIA